MNNLKFAGRKLRLQWLQLQALKSSKKSQRYSEQRRVLLLLLKPNVLLSTKNRDLKENQLFKYTNTLNRYVKDDKLYSEAKDYMVSL